MATGMEMAMQAALPMLKKMIPPEVWEAVEKNIVSLSSKVADVEKRLAGIEDTQREILHLLRRMGDLRLELERSEQNEPHTAARNGHGEF